MRTRSLNTMRRLSGVSPGEAWIKHGEQETAEDDTQSERPCSKLNCVRLIQTKPLRECTFGPEAALKFGIVEAELLSCSDSVRAAKGEENPRHSQLCEAVMEAPGPLQRRVHELTRDRGHPYWAPELGIG